MLQGDGLQGEVRIIRGIIIIWPVVLKKIGRGVKERWVGAE